MGEGRWGKEQGVRSQDPQLCVNQALNCLFVCFSVNHILLLHLGFHLRDQTLGPKQVRKPLP